MPGVDINGREYDPLDDVEPEGRAAMLAARERAEQKQAQWQADQPPTLAGLAKYLTDITDPAQRKQRARELYPHIEQKNQQQMLAYREMPDADLFSEQWVSVPINPREMPGYKSARITCEACGEGVNYDREVRQIQDEVVRTLCQGCAAPETRYYRELTQQELDSATNSQAGAEKTPQPACEHR